MESIRDFSTGISGNVSELFTGPLHLHAFKGIEELVHGETLSELFFQDSVHNERHETGEEMCPDAVISLDIDRTGPELCLHDPKALLDLPSVRIDSHDLIDAEIIDGGAYGIKAVIPCFFLNDSLIEERDVHLADLTVLRGKLMVNETVRVVLVLPVSLIAPCFQQLHGTPHLCVPDLFLIFLIFNGIGDDEPLLQGLYSFLLLFFREVLDDPFFLIEDPVVVLFL